MAAAEYQARIAADGIDVVLDRSADEWRASIDVLGDLEIVDTNSLGYVGMSMGTRFGLPLGAILGDRVRCVAFGKFGLQQTPLMPKGLDSPERVARDARRITATALFHMQWHDDVFPRDGQLALFDLLGSSDKQLIAYSGTHGQTKPEAVSLWRDFVAVTWLTAASHRATNPPTRLSLKPERVYERLVDRADLGLWTVRPGISTCGAVVAGRDARPVAEAEGR